MVTSYLCAVEPTNLFKVQQDGAQSNRVTVAMLGIGNGTGEAALAPWRMAAEASVVWGLMEVKAVRMLPDVDYALKQLAMVDGSLADEKQARRLGELIRAQWVIWGAYQRTGENWLVTMRVLRLGEGKPAKELTASSSRWHEIGERLTEKLLQELGVRPSEAELYRMRERWRVSPRALENYGRVAMLQVAGGPLAEQEALLRQTIKFDPQFADAYVTLAGVLSNKGEVLEAEDAVRRSLRLRPHFADAQRWLGTILASEGKDDEAENAFRSATRLNPDDAEAFMRLGYLHGHQGRYVEAADELNRALEINPHAHFAAAVTALLAEVKAMITPTCVSFVPPEDYGESAMLEELRRRLTPEESRLVVNPLVGTREMHSWAQQLTAGATNDEAKARVLFETLAHRVRENSRRGPGSLRTAREVFADWNKHDVSFYCGDYAVLYVALARAVGIKAYYVDVQETADGGCAPHACAAVVLKEKRLLVDPLWLAFGVAHKRFSVLNDLQATAIYVSQFPDIKRSEIACKLAPDLPLVQLNLFEKLIRSGRLGEARQVLPVIKRLDKNVATGDYVEAGLALLAGKPESAINLLLKAIAANPQASAYHVLLANAYAQENRVTDAREALQNALRCPLTTQEADGLQKYLSNTNDMAAWVFNCRGFGMYIRGDFTGALRNYDQAVELKPDCAEAYAGRGNTRLAKGDLDGALADYRMAIQLRPEWGLDNAHVYLMSGRSRYDRLQFTEALADFQKACELGSCDDYTQFRIWLTRARLGQQAKADRELQTYMDSRDVTNRGDWASALGNYLLGRVTEADLLKDARSSSERTNTTRLCEAYFYAGTKQLIAGDKEAAINYLKKCLETQAKEEAEYTSAEAELRFLERAKASGEP
jgi:tetratricopeptide (TPR) repeat protein